ncbi:MAG: hypothetical protein K0U74_06300 [Alphaproteobacteria bacterium]|nr:hypothetical protein [Alphaproteobacteria bacterium]
MRFHVTSLCAAAATLALIATMPASAQNVTINTGGESGAYHGQFCPALTKKLEKAGVTGQCKTSDGTTDNMQRVADAPEQLGYGQLDVLALKAGQFGGPSSFSRLRMDDVRECIFAVTKDKSLENYGDVAVRSDELRIVLPPEKSGSAATFRYLQKIDPYGVGRASDIIHAADTDEAIKIALSSDKTVALFVQFPDPDNARFKLASKKGGHIIPVIDRTILEQRVDGVPVYFAQETQVANANWLSSGTRVVTACTPLVVFTGPNDAIKDDAARATHAKVSSTLRGLRGEDLLPTASLFARVLKRTRELTATGAEKFVDISEKARAKSQSVFEKAREAARKAVGPGHNAPADSAN